MIAQNLKNYFTAIIHVGLFISLTSLHCQTESQENRNNSGDTSVTKDTVDIDPLARMGENMRELAIDLLNYNACSRLKDRIFVLSQKQGATAGAGKAPSVGSFWIRSCSTTQIDPQHMRVAISGIGWRWLSRKKTAVGAEFELDENVKFEVDISTTGTVDLAYDQEEKIVTGYLVPTDSVDVTIAVTGDLDIETDEIWSSIVGTAAEVAGAAPKQKAEKAIKKKGGRQLRSRLTHGMTVIIDLCTGQQYTKMGTFPAGQLPQSAFDEPEMNFQANSPATLYPNSMVMVGPFATRKPLIAYVEVDSGGPVEAGWLCSYNAEKIAEAYVRNDSLPDVKPIDRRIAKVGEPITMRAERALECRVVLMMKPAEENDSIPPSLLYRVYYEGDVRKPLVQCDGGRQPK